MSTENPSFLAAGELEFVFCDPGSIRQQNIERLTHPRISDARPPRVSEASILRDLREDAKAMLGTLQPVNDVEADRLAMWKAQVPDMTVEDAVNFRIYEGHSAPRLTTKQSTVDMTRTELMDLHGREPLEFRFGKGIYQEGYYDNPTVSELRTTPDTPEAYAIRRTWLTNRAADVATRHGKVAYLASEHMHTSAFYGERPTFGDPDTAIEPYRAAAAGLRRLFLDGGLYDAAQYPTMPAHMEIGPWRNTTDFRMLPGRFELRTMHLPGESDIYSMDQMKSFAFMLAGMRYGLEHATDQDKAAVEVMQITASSPGSGYDRERDLDLQRFLGGLRMVGEAVELQQSSEAEGAFTLLTGQPAFPSKATQQEFVAGLRLQDGKLYMPYDAFESFVSTPNYGGSRRWGWDNVAFDHLNQSLSRVAITPTTSVAWQGDLLRNALTDEPIFDLAQSGESLGKVAPAKLQEIINHQLQRTVSALAPLQVTMMRVAGSIFQPLTPPSVGKARFAQLPTQTWKNNRKTF